MNADPITLTGHFDPEISSSQPGRYLSRRYLSSYRFEIFLQSNTGLWNRISDVATKTERRVIYITPVDEYIVTREAARRDRFNSAPIRWTRVGTTKGWDSRTGVISREIIRACPGNYRHLLQAR